MSYRSRLYNHRNAQSPELNNDKPFFSKQQESNEANGKGSFFQAKLTVNKPGDKYEQEADSVANTVVNNKMTAPLLQQKKISSIQRLSAPTEEEKLASNSAGMEKDKEIQTKQIQRMTPDPEEEKLKGIQKMDDPAKEEEDKKKTAAVQTKQHGAAATALTGVSSKIESNAGKGNALPANTLHEMNISFGSDFSDVRVHKDAEAAGMNKELAAQAFTHGSDIYFNEGRYNPGTIEGKSLLAHELTHVVQQSGDKISRKKLGSKFSHGTTKASPYKVISALFDGKEFHLFGDKIELMKVSADSGRPYSVKANDAKDCKGSVSDSYKNNPRYVGIKDNGPIPEGMYGFSTNKMSIFSAAEQVEMISGGSYTDPFGTSLHGGDWGSGRVALTPIKISPGPKGCGDTSKRSGFFLHGGSLPGSSGCIDIGNAAIDQLVTYLKGYHGSINVEVIYKFPPPAVGPLERALGRATYPGQENPSILDRVKAGLFGD